MALQPRDVSEIQRRVKEGNITREFVDEIKSRAGRLSVRQLAGLPEQDVKASKVQSIQASDPQVTTGNQVIREDADIVRQKRLADGTFETLAGDPTKLKDGKDGLALKSATPRGSAVDVVLDADVRGKRGVSDAKRKKAEEARLPEDVRIKRQFEQLYRKQKAEDRTKILQGFAKEAMDAAPEGGSSPYQAMEAELSNIMRSRLNLPEEEEQKPSLLESLKSGISSFFADDRKTSAGETLVDSISGEGKQDPRVQALAALEAANMPTTEANIQAVLAQLQEGG